MTKTKFDFYDYFIFFFILFISIAIGLFFGFNLNEKFKNILKKFFKSSQKVNPNSSSAKSDKLSSDDKKQLDHQGDGEKSQDADKPTADEENQTMEYLTANKSMSAFPIALSILATFFSSSSLLGFPAEVYQYGIQYWIIVFGVCLVPLIGGNALFY